MKDISKLYEYFQRYQDGEMSGDEKAAFEKKMKNDPDMQSAYADFELLLKTVADKDALEVRRELKTLLEKRRNNNSSWIRSIVWNPWSAAAAALFVLVIAVYFIYINLFMDEKSMSQNLVTTLEQIDWNDPAYSISPEYADLLRIEHRSDGFRFYAPADSMVYVQGDMISFSWKYQGESIGIDILNADGIFVTGKENIIEGTFEMKVKFDPGAYLFRISNEEEALHWGVFFCMPGKEQ